MLLPGKESLQMILFINACVRAESRTRKLAEEVMAEMDDRVVEVRLEEMSFPKVDERFLIERERLVAEGELEADILQSARQFAQADRIVIAAPFWELSFPSILKQYLEQITVSGITFQYSEEGIPQGLCKADRLVYVTTAGGNYFPEEFGFGYVKALAQGFYGIGDVQLVKKLGLDI